MASTSFAKDHPEVHGWISNFSMPSDKLASLEDVMFNQNNGDDYGPALTQWIADNRAWVDGLTS